MKRADRATQLTPAYRDGYEAHGRGVDSKDNPYRKFKDSSAWIHGWVKAEEEEKARHSLVYNEAHENALNGEVKWNTHEGGTDEYTDYEAGWAAGYAKLMQNPKRNWKNYEAWEMINGGDRDLP